jgi:hypothetical protein
MATATEATFWAAVTAAAGVRQVAYAAAQATYAAAGFTPGARATYIAAAVTADIACQFGGDDGCRHLTTFACGSRAD